MLVIGIDPSSGSSSPVGLAIFDPVTYDIFVLDQINVDKKLTPHRRLVSIHEQLSERLCMLDAQSERIYTFMETFVMQGKNGQLLANASGAIMAAVPSEFEFATVQNTTVKKLVGGTGKADKEMVAVGCYKHFEEYPTSAQKVREAINACRWDALDALAIGIAGYQREMQNG